MGDRAGTYSVIQDFGFQPEENPDRIDSDPYWVVAVVRLGMPLSFSRAKMASITKDITAGAIPRSEKPLVITDDIISIQIQGSKNSHKKQCSFFAKSTEVNYLNELFGGDWCLAWLVNNRDDFNTLLKFIDAGKQANYFTSGLKFVGRIDSVRKSIDIDPQSGTVTSGYSVNCIGFDELDTRFFYDNTLGSRDAFEKDLGLWLTRLGLDVQALFGENTQGGLKQNNVNILIPTLLDLIVGHGPPHKQPIQIEGPVQFGKPSLNSPTPQELNDAPFSYIIPEQAAAFLGKKPEDASKHVLGYSDILELVTGVQQYSNKNGFSIFAPDFSDSKPTRRTCTKQMLGTFLPFFSEFTNKPLWSVLQQYLNPTINEMYTCLRVNPEGLIMPTIILRQIPFTTDAFVQDGGHPAEVLSPDTFGPPTPAVPSSAVDVTRFLDLPRWEIPSVMLRHLDVGRSNVTRTNFIHVFGSNSYQTNNVPIQYQMVVNPPIRDDIDIIRCGLKPYMASVDCWVGDQVGIVAGSWMKLVADRTIGSHLTLNGSITTVGIQSPICEGDNLVCGDGSVYHIESVSHHASINTHTGAKNWQTTMTLTNGMRQLDDGEGVDNENSAWLQDKVPIYPGFLITDGTTYDPGLTAEQGRHTTGGVSHLTPRFAATEDDVEPSQLDSSTQQPTAVPKKRGISKKRRKK